MKPRLYAAWGTSSLHLVMLSSMRVAIGGFRPLLPTAPLGSGSSLTSQTPSFPRWPGNRWEAAGPRRKHNPPPTHLPGARLFPVFSGKNAASPHGAVAHLPSRAPFCGFFMSFGYYLLLSNPPPCFLQLGLLSHFPPPPAPSRLGLCRAPLLLPSPWRPDPSSHAVHSQRHSYSCCPSATCTWCLTNTQPRPHLLLPGLQPRERSRSVTRQRGLARRPSRPVF